MVIRGSVVMSCSRPPVATTYRSSSRSAASSVVCVLEYTWPTPRRVGSPMSQIQPALCAVEMVWHAMGHVGSVYGTCSGERAIVEQHVLLRGDVDAVVLADQQRTHAGAVDEQVAFDRAVLARLQRCDVAVVVRVHARHVIGDVPHARGARCNACA